MRRAAIIGRSPFINQVDINKVMTEYETIGINGVVKDFALDHAFYYDWYIEPKDKRTLVHLPRHKEHPEGCHLIASRNNSEPVREAMFESDGAQVLSFKYFTVTMAVNWAAISGYNEIILIGIDHIESDLRFSHYDGDIDEGDMYLPKETHQGVKNFIQKCADLCPIYQTNPHVKDDWPIPYKELQF